MASVNKLWAIVPAAGVGVRFGGEVPKQYVLVNGKPIIEHTVDVLLSHHFIDKVFVAIQQGDAEWHKTNCAKRTDVATVLGGDSRLHSVFNCLLSLQGDADAQDWVLVHDAVRPAININLIDDLLTAVSGHAVGGLLGVPEVDTVKTVNQQGDVLSTIPRATVWRAQTPQVFRYGLLFDALKKAIDESVLVTDESNAVEMLGFSPKMVLGSFANIKITSPEDMFLFNNNLNAGVK